MKPLIVILALTLSGCAARAPGSLSPTGQTIWQANQSAVVLGEIQHVSIALNNVQKCATPPATNCAPLLSDGNTRIVVTIVGGALRTLQQIPAGWKSTTQTALTQIGVQLDAAGKSQVTPYITAAQTILGSL